MVVEWGNLHVERAQDLAFYNALQQEGKTTLYYASVYGKNDDMVQALKDAVGAKK